MGPGKKASVPKAGEVAKMPERADKNHIKGNKWKVIDGDVDNKSVMSGETRTGK